MTASTGDAFVGRRGGVQPRHEAHTNCRAAADRFVRWLHVTAPSTAAGSRCASTRHSLPAQGLNNDGVAAGAHADPLAVHAHLVLNPLHVPAGRTLGGTSAQVRHAGLEAKACRTAGRLQGSKGRLRRRRSLVHPSQPHG